MKYDKQKRRSLPPVRNKSQIPGWLEMTPDQVDRALHLELYGMLGLAGDGPSQELSNCVGRDQAVVNANDEFIRAVGRLAMHGKFALGQALAYWYSALIGFEPYLDDASDQARYVYERILAAREPVTLELRRALRDCQRSDR